MPIIPASIVRADSCYVNLNWEDNETECTAAAGPLNQRGILDNYSFENIISKSRMGSKATNLDRAP